ncbi:hypothetical protein NLI96_g9692 [Meripilus lineatus]|uniref:Uncharacterized protein n=1 Tax=Meripilus lineatus TaxID=2056292 RepID=A0AAD5UV05_9APHY|nr:hypothetical protein NLI96_g9692 [Physisporinus lineatus]
MSDLASKYVLQTAGFDGMSQNLLIRLAIDLTLPRNCSPFPQRQPDQALVRPSSHSSPFLFLIDPPLFSFQNYTDYFKCIAAKGEDFAPCKQFKRAYNSLCPNEWIGKWDDQRENGTFPASLEP